MSQSQSWSFKHAQLLGKFLTGLLFQPNPSFSSNLSLNIYQHIKTVGLFCFKQVFHGHHNCLVTLAVSVDTFFYFFIQGYIIYIC